MAERISVILPIFNKFDPKRLALAVASIQRQDYPDIEIIVAEQNTRPTYKKTAQAQGIAYTFSRVNSARATYNISHVRNAGIKKTTGQYLYLSDADIVFAHPSYLTKVHAYFTQEQVTQLNFPPMKHVLMEDVPFFYEQAKRHGIDYAIDQTQFPDGYTTNRNKRRKLKVIHYGYYMKTYVMFADELKKISQHDLKTYGYGLLNATYHAGTIFAKRSDVLKVGGYCEAYKGWGNDDTDLQIKLILLGKTRGQRPRLSIPKRDIFSVYHLDHEKHLNKKAFDANQAVLQKRLEVLSPKIFLHDRRQNGFAR